MCQLFELSEKTSMRKLDKPVAFSTCRICLCLSNQVSNVVVFDTVIYITVVIVQDGMAVFVIIRMKSFPG